MHFERSDRLKKLPPYMFAEMDRKKKALIDKGKKVISLGIGDPEQPTPAFIINALKKALHNPGVHQYPLNNGSPNFRKAIANFYMRHHKVALDPMTEIYPLIGSKEGIGHIHLGLVNPGDYVLVPEPGYPVYRSGTVFAGGIPYFMPLTSKNRFLPDLTIIPKDVASKSKIMFINYPNNPTGVVADEAFLRSAIKFCTDNNILLCQDAAYSEMFYDKRPLSILELPGGKEVSVEFNSLSKTFNMCGWRVGWVCGNAEAISALAEIKNNLDSGQFTALQEAAAVGLNEGDAETDKIRALYRARRDMFLTALKKMGVEITPPEATFYIWFKVPAGFTSASFCETLLDKTGILLTPGSGFGPSGEGYVRISLTVEDSLLNEAAERISSCKL